MKAAPDLSAIAEQLAAIQRELGQGVDRDDADRELVERAHAAAERLRRSRDAALPGMLAGMRKRGPRVLGPYDEGGVFRVVEIELDVNGKDKRSSQVFDDEAKAQRYVDEARSALEQAAHTTETALAEYKRHLAERGTQPQSIDVTVRAIAQFFPEPLPLQTLSAKRGAALYDELRARPQQCKRHHGDCTCIGRPPAVDTHRNALSQAKSFLAWCVSRGWLRESPLADVAGVGKRRPRGKSLGKDGNELRVKQARAWYAKAVELAVAGDVGAIAALDALLLGMRASEITSRRVGDVDEDEAPADLLWIPCSKTPAGRRTLEVPEVLRPLHQTLCEGREPTSYLFAREDGGRRCRDWIRQQVHRICELAQVPLVTAHAMRGLLATITAERGLAGHLIAATLGHEDERITMHAYAAPGAAAAGVNRRGLVVLQGGQKR